MIIFTFIHVQKFNKEDWQAENIQSHLVVGGATASTGSRELIGARESLKIHVSFCQKFSGYFQTLKCFSQLLVGSTSGGTVCRRSQRSPVVNVLSSLPFMQELEDIRKSGMKHFRNIQADEANILTWQGLIVPVSSEIGGRPPAFILKVPHRLLLPPKPNGVFPLPVSCQLTLIYPVTLQHLVPNR